MERLLFKYSSNELTNEAGTATAPKLMILLINNPKSYSIIALTILPLTVATYILRYVLATSEILRNRNYIYVSITKSNTSGELYLGMTILINLMILYKNTLSTFPFPFFSSFFLLTLMFSVLDLVNLTFNRKRIIAITAPEMTYSLRICVTFL